MSKFINSILLAMAMLTFVGCGDLYMQKEDQDQNFFATCELDVKALSKILTRNLKGQLLCLESNMNLFMKVVRTDLPGHLQYEALETYLRTNVEEIDEQAIQMVKAIFDLNSLIFGGSNKYIERKNVAKLIDILIEFNRIFVGANIYEYFTSNNKVSFDEHNRRKAIVYSALVKIGNLVEKAMVKNNNEIVILDFLERFKNDENKEILSNVERLLFLKKAILGGAEKALTHRELKRMASILGDVGKISYDFVNLPDTNTENGEEVEVLKILKEDIQTAYNNFYYKNTPSQVIVSYKDISELVKVFYPGFQRFIKYKTTFLKIKKILLGSASDNITAADVNFLLKDILYKNVAKGVFVYRVFEENETTVRSRYRILYDLDNVVAFNSEEKAFVGDFNRVIKNYRYYQGSKFSPLFAYNYSRDPRGLFDILLYEYLSKKLFVYYGEKDKNAFGNYIMTQADFVTLLKDFSELLEGEEYILPGRVTNLAETMTMVITLFHAQSNGDVRVEIPEFVEFIITLTASMNFTDDMKEYLFERCEVDDKQRIQPSCYREHFLSYINTHLKKNDKPVQSFIPNLYNYLTGLEGKEVDKYLKATAKFSRVCTNFNDRSEVPMNYGDFFVTWGGLLSIEQSLLRFDTNKSGVLEPREVDNAYYVYKEAIEEMIPYAYLKKFSKQFFQYIIKFKRVPEVPNITGPTSLWNAVKQGVHFAWFITAYSERERQGSADRMTFALVLQVIAQNSPENLKNPYPCETLR